MVVAALPRGSAERGEAALQDRPASGLVGSDVLGGVTPGEGVPGELAEVALGRCASAATGFPVSRFLEIYSSHDCTSLRMGMRKRQPSRRDRGKR